MNEEIDEIFLENVSSYYRAIGSPKRLKILLELGKDEKFVTGMKWPELRTLTGLSSGALKRHIDTLIETGLLAETKSSYRITRSGLGLLTQVEEVAERIREILQNKEEMKEIVEPFVTRNEF